MRRTIKVMAVIALMVALSGLASSCGEQTRSGDRNEKPAQKVENAQAPATTTTTTKPAGKEKPEQTAEAKKREEPATEKAATEQYAAERTTEQAAQEEEQQQYAAKQYAAERRAVADPKQAADRTASAEKAAAEQYAVEQTKAEQSAAAQEAEQYSEQQHASGRKQTAEKAVAEQYAAGQEAGLVRQRAITDPASPVSQATAAPSSTTLSLTVPKLGLYGVPVVDDVSEAGLSQGAGHLPGTGFPWQGEGSNTYIAGHRLGYPGTPSDHVFYDLPNLAPGDSVSLTDENGTTYTYAVSEVHEVSPADLWVSSAVAGRDVVTLQTCIEDFGDEWTPGPDWLARYIVRADRV